MNVFRKFIGRRAALAFARVPMWSVGSDEGQTLAEYALILAFIAVLAVAALVFLGGDITKLFSSTGNSI